MMIWWIYLSASTVGFTAGSLLLKRFADGGDAFSLLLSVLVLAASNVLFIQVIRGGLSQGVIASSMLQIVLIAALGALVFGERLSAAQILGVAMAISSIYLFAGPGGSPD